MAFRSMSQILTPGTSSWNSSIADRIAGWAPPRWPFSTTTLRKPWRARLPQMSRSSGDQGRRPQRDRPGEGHVLLAGGEPHRRGDRHPGALRHELAQVRRHVGVRALGQARAVLLGRAHRQQHRRGLGDQGLDLGPGHLVQPARGAHSTSRRRPAPARRPARRRTAPGSPSSTIRPSCMNATDVGDLAGEPQLVGDHDHRHPVVGEQAHDVEDVAHQLGVERRGRLVEQHHPRPHRERPGDRHPLLLAARELVRVGRELAAEADPGEQLAGGGVGLLPAGAAAWPPARRPRSQHRHVREQLEALEHEPDPATAAGQLALGEGHQPVAVAAVADELAVEGDQARVDRLQVGEAAQERALARARAAEHGDDLAGADLQVHVPQHLQAPVALPDVLDAEQAAARAGAGPAAGAVGCTAVSATSGTDARVRGPLPEAPLDPRLQERAGRRPGACTRPSPRAAAGSSGTSASRRSRPGRAARGSPPGWPARSASACR